VAEIPCPRCRATGTVPDPGLSRWQCRACGHSYFLRRCTACRRVSYVGGFQGYNQSWACTWCAQPNAGFRQRRDPAAATAAELAAELAASAGAAPRLPPAGGVPAPPGKPPGGPPEPGGSPGTAPPRGRRARWWSRRTLIIAVALLVVLAAGVATGVSVGGSGLASAPAAGPSAAPDGPVGTVRPAGSAAAEVGQTSRPVSVTGTGVGTVDFDGVAGQLTVTAGSGPVRLTGMLNWTGQPPRTSVRRDRSGRVLQLSYQCAPASPCSGDYRLMVPAGTTLAVRQPSGQVTLSGLSGSLTITAASADVVARHLRTADLRAAITAGQLTASFDTPPTSVQVVLTRAQATVRLPGAVHYRISQQVSSGSVDVRVPRSSSAGRTIVATVNDSQLTLLPS
jgi:hypothetical protein